MAIPPKRKANWLWNAWSGRSSRGARFSHTPTAGCRVSALATSVRASVTPASPPAVSPPRAVDRSTLRREMCSEPMATSPSSHYEASGPLYVTAASAAQMGATLAHSAGSSRRNAPSRPPDVPPVMWRLLHSPVPQPVSHRQQNHHRTQSIRTSKALGIATDHWPAVHWPLGGPRGAISCSI